MKRTITTMLAEDELGIDDNLEEDDSERDEKIESTEEYKIGDEELAQ